MDKSLWSLECIGYILKNESCKIFITSWEKNVDVTISRIRAYEIVLEGS